MKKILFLITILFLGITLFACDENLITDTTDYTEAIETLSETIIEQLPVVFNRSIELPQDELYEITYAFLGETYTDMLIYVSPLYDREETLEITIARGQTTLTFEHEMFVLAKESGRNENKIYLTMDVSVNQIDREIYTQTDVSVSTNINGETVIEHETSEAQIRGRGNSTWFLSDKKPYRLRFDKNTSILGMPEAKNYILLAEYSDKSLMRNMLVQKMVSFMSDLPRALETRFVELYINGEYRGVYLLTEHVETHPNKFYIESTPGILDTGYFFELDQRLFESGTQPGFDWFTVDGIPYDLKDPDPSDPAYTTAHIDYIKGYLRSLDQALYAKEGYESLMDLDNWVSHFIIHEYVKNVDVGWSSVFMYKEKGGPIAFGPLWDFDLAIGNADYIDYGVENFYGMRAYKNHHFILMMQIPEIREQYREMYMDFYFDVIPQILGMIPHLEASITEMAARNFERWPILGTYVWPNPDPMVSIDTHHGQVQYVMDYLEARGQWMAEALWTEAYEAGDFEPES